MLICIYINSYNSCRLDLNCRMSPFSPMLSPTARDRGPEPTITVWSSETRAQGNVVGNREGIYDRKRNPWRRNKRGERVRVDRRFKAMIPQPYVGENSYQQTKVQIAPDNCQDVPISLHLLLDNLAIVSRGYNVSPIFQLISVDLSGV